MRYFCRKSGTDFPVKLIITANTYVIIFGCPAFIFSDSGNIQELCKSFYR